MGPSDTVVAAILGKDLGAVAALTVFGLVGVWMVVVGVRKFRTGYEMRASEVIPTTAVASASGAVEIQGAAKPLNGTVTAPYTETDCLAYTYRTRRREHDHGHDDDAGPQYRTVDSGSDRCPFRVEDDAGSVVVDPTDGDVSMERHGLDAPGRDERSESRLDVGETVHVYGTRREGAPDGDAADGHEAFVGDGEAAPLQVTDASAEEAVGRRLKNGAISTGIGAVIVVGATYFLLFG